MKLFLKKHPYLSLLLWSGLLPLLSVALGLTYDAYNPFGDEVIPPIVCGIVNVAWPLWWLFAVAHVFGVTELLRYGIIVKDEMLEALGLKRILPTALVAAMGSYLLMCFLQFPFYTEGWGRYLELGTLFAVLPAMVAVLLRYGLWRWQWKQQK